ncbi:MAG: hypothetical protein A2X12_09135 [Bacteroidetes bacterium GWE2_29_8]|nr:MAG: hypothetical protein A2X12_09135 [Bacteroidetes bacterium GWE2_29_8]
MQDLKVTIIQPDVLWEDVNSNLSSYTEKIDSISEQTDLIILPETFTTGFSMNMRKCSEQMNGKTIKWMKDQSRKTNAVVMGSIFVKEVDRFYNRLIWVEPNGIFHYYDKRHLFRMSNEHLYVKQGDRRLIVTLNGWKIYPLICYDLRFPIWSTNKYSKTHENYSYDCLIYIANWPEKRDEAWETLLKARAIENQAYTIGVNRIGIDGNNFSYCGNSMVVNYKGKTISALEKNEEKISSITLNYEELEDYRRHFDVAKDWDKFKLLKFGKEISENDAIISEIAHSKKEKPNKTFEFIKKHKGKFLVALVFIIIFLLYIFIFRFDNSPNAVKFKESDKFIKEQDKRIRAVNPYEK